MAQLLIRKLDEAVLETLRTRAKANKTSVEALAREALRQAAELTIDEKRGLVRQMQGKFKAAQLRREEDFVGWQLIREGRDAR